MKKVCLLVLVIAVTLQVLAYVRTNIVNYIEWEDLNGEIRRVAMFGNMSGASVTVGTNLVPFRVVTCTNICNKTVK